MTILRLENVSKTMVHAVQGLSLEGIPVNWWVWLAPMVLEKARPYRCWQASCCRQAPFVFEMWMSWKTPEVHEN